MTNKYTRYGLRHENHVLRERGTFVLMQRVFRGFRPDGDGWEAIWEEERWNGNSNPLELTAKVRAAKKQAAARMVRKVEMADAREVWMLDPETEEYAFLGRNEGEVRPASAVQATRGTNFARGGIYSRGMRAVREALKKRKEYDEAPTKVKGAEEVRQEKIAELEAKIQMYMGLLKK